MSDAGPEVLVGLLADEGRLKVLSAIARGAGGEPEIATATGLDAKTVRKALERLVRGGIVEATPQGTLRVLAQRNDWRLQRVAATSVARRRPGCARRRTRRSAAPRPG